MRSISLSVIRGGAYGFVRNARVDEDHLTRMGGIAHAVHDAGQLSREDGDELQLVVVVQVAGGAGDLTLKENSVGMERELRHVLPDGFVTHFLPFSRFVR